MIDRWRTFPRSNRRTKLDRLQLAVHLQRPGEDVDLCQIVGFTEEEFLATTWMALTHPDDLETDLGFARKLLSGEIPYYRMEKRYIHKDSHTVWILLGGSLVRGLHGEPIYYVSHVLDITERKRAEALVQASLEEKQFLLREIHHRVKNNLQVISSLLDLQSLHTKDKESVEMFRESRNRVRSMALVHERLYRSQHLARVDFSGYIESLADYLFQTYRTDSEAIRLEVAVAPEIHLPIDTAVPCGLLINELVSNCLKHAFRGRETGVIRIELRPEGDDQLFLRVADDGLGLPEAVDLRVAESFGMELIGMLVKQLRGTVEIDRSAGTSFRITFALPRRNT